MGETGGDASGCFGGHGPCGRSLVWPWVTPPEAVVRLVLFTALLSAGELCAEDKKDDARKAFQGTWTIVGTRKGDAKGKEPVTAPTVVFDGDRSRIKAGDKVVEDAP